MKVLHVDTLNGRLFAKINDPHGELRIGNRLRDERGNEFSVAGIGMVHNIEPGNRAVLLSGSNVIGETVEII